MANARILFVHGVGHQSVREGWKESWEATVRRGMRSWSRNVDFEPHFLELDDIFAAHPITWAGTASAVGKLTWNRVSSMFGFGAPARSMAGRGLFDGWSESVRWSAGMVVQWVENQALRSETRQRLGEKIQEVRPDVLCAHSLGSLVGYDFLTDPTRSNAMPNGTFISLGSQIGNPFVVGSFAAGRLTPVYAKRWYHLYNEHDQVFTAPIRIVEPQFRQVWTPFDSPGILNHDAAPSEDNPEAEKSYLGHPATADVVWRALAEAAPAARNLGGFLRTSPVQSPTPEAMVKAAKEAEKSPTKRKVLLIGINDYPNPAMKLEGCVNDVYKMSAALQDCGFDPEHIRVVLDERATASAIRERLHWLLDDVQSGDERVLYFSGHGAQLPDYNAMETTDHVDECLVPYDFDWSRDRAVADDEFRELYSQLPYDSTFVAIFDCCHSGGLSRAPGVRCRGLTPPDDIRHRMLKWDSKSGMWIPRELNPIGRGDWSNAKPKEVKRFCGATGTAFRLGRAASVRSLPPGALEKEAKRRGHAGPYMPYILEACQEGESAFEYRDGATSYGAFTFNLCKHLREAALGHAEPPTLDDLLQKVRDDIDLLGYPQKPQLEGPSRLRDTLLKIVLARRAGPVVAATPSAAPKSSAPRKKAAKKKLPPQ